MARTLTPPAPERGGSEGARPLARPSRIDGLDGMRALAVVAVLLYHAGVPWARGGFLGVDVFFVLSGYLVTSLVIGTLDRDGAVDLRAFWLGRARRLAPALLTLLVATTWAVLLLHRDELADLRGQVLSSLTGTTNWYLIANDSSYFDQLGRPPYLRHLWSIAVELQFYLVVPPVLAALLRRERGRLDRVAVGLVGAVAVSAVWMALAYDAVDPSRAYYSTFTRLQAPLLGVLLALVWRRRYLVRGAVAGAGARLTGAGAAALAVLALFLLRAGDTDAWMYRGGFLVVAVLSAVVVAAVTHPHSGLGGPRALGHPWLVAIGVRSYCLYLWHWPVYVLTRPGIDLSWGWGPVFVLRILLTVALTEVCYRAIERPWHKGRRTTGSAARPDGPTRRNRTLLAGGALVAAVVAAAALLFAHPKADAIEESLVAGQAALDANATSAPATTTAPPTTASTVPASTEPGETTTEPPTTTTTAPPAVVVPNVIVGDSVMVGAAPELLAAFPDATTIDAEVGRRASASADAVRNALSQRPDAETVVVQMGNNGALSTAMIEEVDAAADGRRVLFVNVRVPKDWEGEVNGLLDEVVPTLDDAAVIDWHGISEGHGDWFLGDQVHLTAAGRAAFADAIASAVDR